MPSAPPRRSRLSTGQRARIADHLRQTPPGGTGGAVRRRFDRSRHPLSYAQHQLWVLDRMEAPGPLYNVPRAFRVHGLLDLPALAKALRALTGRHEVLRSSVARGEEGPYAAIAGRAALALPVADLSALPGPARGEESRRLAAGEAERPFDLERGPLARFLAVRLGGGEHLLAVTFHHLAVDARSLAILFDELGMLYDVARGVGRPPPAPLVDYGDFAVWQRERLDSRALEEDLAWWRERLRGTLPETRLPCDRPRPGKPSRSGAVIDRSLPGALRERILQLARVAGTTPFSVVAAAVAVLLARYSDRQEVCFATVLGNRPRPELDGVVGNFVNPVVLRSTVAGGVSAVELIRRVRSTVLAAMDHGEAPFELVVRNLAPERSAGRNPLFQVMLVYQSGLPVPPQLGGLEASSLETPRTTAKFDFSFELWEEGDGLRLRIEYSAELFDRTTALRVAGHLETLLAGLVEAPEREVAEIGLLAGAERHALIFEWAGEERPYPSGETLGSLVAAVCRELPDRVALVDADRQVSYGELWRRVRTLADLLRERGVGSEVPVGVCLHRSAELVVSLLGVIDAGGFYAPLDPASPRRRHEQVLDDTGVRTLVAGQGEAERLPPFGGIVLHPVAGAAEESRPGVPRAVAAGPESLAYVMYTSGSTGRPKGVAVSHRSVIRLVRGNDFIRFGADETFLLFAPTAFDASTLELWGPLLEGGRLEIPPAEPSSLRELAGFVARRRVTTLWLTAALFGRLGDGELEQLRGLRHLLAGGDVLPRGRVEQALAKLPETVLLNGYGPTENTTFTCCHRMHRPADAGRRGAPVPVGRPIANGRVAILDRQLRPVPVGVAGELSAGGAGVARGYLGQPAATAARFVPDPLAARPGGRAYRTGDLARWLPDGGIEFLGRTDDQVKVRGFRVEPGEVAAVLTELPEVAEAAVVARGGTEDRELLAYVVPRAEGLTEAEVLARLREELPAPMVPAAVVILAELPLNAHGKLERSALPEPERNTAPGCGSDPRGPVEQVIAGLWVELLGLDAVGREDDFFSLGGHSLRVMKLGDRLREVFEIDLPLAALFERPTVAGIAAFLTADSERSPDVARTAELMLEIGALSDDEVEALLERAGDPPHPMRVD
jgi:amino acid adenylation domain-containing protein